MQHVDVTWVALECRVRQEQSDEVLGSVNMIAVTNPKTDYSHKFPGDGATWTMGEDGERIVAVGVPMYSGPPVPLYLIVHLVEHDSGNIDAYKEVVAEAVAKAAEAVASALSSGATASAQPVTAPILRFGTRGLVDIAADLFGTDDDAYNPAQLAWRPEDPLPPRNVLRRADDPRTADYTHVVTVAGTDDGGDRGEYAFYFDIRVTGAGDGGPIPGNGEAKVTTLPRSGSPVSVARDATHLDVFYIGPDGAVATQWWAAEAGKYWSDHAPFPITPPGAARDGS